MAVTLATLWLRADISGLFDNRPLLILLTLPIIFSAVIGGIGPGLLSTLVAAIGSAYAFPPEQSIWIANRHDQIQCGFLLINGVVVSILSELLHRTSRKAELNLRKQLDAINALRARDQELGLEHARLAAIVESASDAIIGKDLTGVVTSWNRAAETIFGIPAELAIGRTLSSLVVPSELQREEADILARIARGEAVPHLTTVRRRADGTRIDVAVTVSPIRAPDGRIIGAAKTVRDITPDRRQLARFRLATDASGIGIWVWRLKDGQLSWDARMFELYGVPDSARDGALQYRFWTARVHAEDLAPVEAYLRRLVAGESADSPVYRIVRGDGELRWIRAAAIVEYDGAGQPLQVVGTNLDITEETLAKNHVVELNTTLEAQVAQRTADLNETLRTLDEREKFIRTVTNSLPMMIGYWDADLHLRFANDAYRDWFGKNPEKLIGISMRELMGAAVFALSEPHVRGALRGEEQSFERTLSKPDGSTGHTLATYVPDVADGRVRGFYVMVADVTRLKAAELRLAEVNVELERRAGAAEGATRAKSEFLANMSHEIRTPMNGILGLCYLMEKQELPPASREMLRRINGAGHALLEIINDILDFSKIEAGRLLLENVPFRLSGVLDNLATLMSVAACGRQVELVVGPVPAGVDYLTGDPLRLGQVLINLVGNAIKFTEQGEVVVRVDRLGEAALDDRAQLRFSVRDTGIGIAADKQALIFKAFSQADTSTTRTFGGTGLGLTISNRLVELMGGTFKLDSAPGKGSEFSFEIALALSDPGASVVPEMAHQRVLIADDHDTARAVLAETVVSLGWQAEAVASGEQAVSRVRTAAAPGYDILVLDWRMPGLDGVQTAAQIRASTAHQTDPIVVMVTAHDRELLLLENGSEVVDAILTKPVTGSSLYYAVMEAKNRRRELRLPSVVPTGEARLTDVRLLVVDDSDLNRDVAANILISEGATIELAEDGRAALAALNDKPDYFDLVLMDIQMPVMDGYAATRQIRATAGLAGLPVVALSAGAFNEERERALAAGMNDFIAKPFEVDLLVATVLRLTRPSLFNAFVAAGEPAGQIAVAAENPDPCLDFEHGLRLWRRVDVYQRYLHRFVAENGQLLARIAAADAAGRRGLAHRLKGAAANLGLPQVAAAAGELDRPDVPDPGAAIVRLKTALDDARTAVARLLPASVAEEEGSAGPFAGDPAALRALVDQALRALAEANPDAVEPLLAALAQALPRERLKPVREALDNFDFRSAAQLLSQLAVDQRIFPEA